MYANSYDGQRKKIHWQEFWRHELESMLSQAPVVIVPAGSVEQHGPHFPTDNVSWARLPSLRPPPKLRMTFRCW